MFLVDENGHNFSQIWLIYSTGNATIEMIIANDVGSEPSLHLKKILYI